MTFAVSATAVVMANCTKVLTQVSYPAANVASEHAAAVCEVLWLGYCVESTSLFTQCTPCLLQAHNSQTHLMPII